MLLLQVYPSETSALDSKSNTEHHGPGISLHRQQGALLLCWAGEGSCPRGEAEQSSQPCCPWPGGFVLPGSEHHWGKQPGTQHAVAAAFAQLRYLAKEGSPTSQAGSLPKPRAGNNHYCIPATLTLIHTLPALVFGNNKHGGGKPSLRSEVKDQSRGRGRCLMTAATHPGPGLTHAASRINERCTHETRVLAPAHWQPRPQKSPAPAALLPAPSGSFLQPPHSQPSSKLPLFPKAALAPPTADGPGGQTARGGSSCGRAAQGRGQPGAALREAGGRVGFPASPEKGSQMGIYILGTQFSRSCGGCDVVGSSWGLMAALLRLQPPTTQHTSRREQINYAIQGEIRPQFNILLRTNIVSLSAAVTHSTSQ